MCKGNKLLDNYEPLLDKNEKRLTTYPIKNKELWDLYKKHVAAFWVPEEIPLTKDLPDWINKLNDKERHFIKYILAFFAASDGIVSENLSTNFMNEVTCLEAQYFYSFQNAMENIHAETYSMMLDNLIQNKEEKETLFKAVENIPTIKKKAEWCKKWMDSGFDYNTLPEFLVSTLDLIKKKYKKKKNIPDCVVQTLEWLNNKTEKPFSQRLVAFACVEGIFFSGSFCALFWLKKRGLMKGLTFSNEFISRDEGMHQTFACVLHSKLRNKVPQDVVYQIVREAVEIECEFITEALSCDLINMNSTKMMEYIKFVADRLIKDLGYKPIYNVKNPFDFMEMISMSRKTNFFDDKVSDYRKACLMSTDKKQNEFSLTEDF